MGLVANITLSSPYLSSLKRAVSIVRQHGYSGGVIRISERSLGINSASTRGFRGENLVGDVTGVATAGTPLEMSLSQMLVEMSPMTTSLEATPLAGATPRDFAGATPGDVTGDITGSNITPGDMTEGDVAGGRHHSHMFTAPDICGDTIAGDITAGEVTGGNKIATPDPDSGKR